MSLINQNNNSQKDISFNNDTVKPTVDKKDEFIDNPILSQLSKRYKVKSTLRKSSSNKKGNNDTANSFYRTICRSIKRQSEFESKSKFD